MKVVLLLACVALCRAALGLHHHQRQAPSACDAGAARDVILSAFNGGTPLPLAFQWMDILATNFTKPTRRYVLLLHGDTLLFGLSGSSFSAFLTGLHDRGVHVRICLLCLRLSGHDVSELLPFVVPVAFSVDYMATEAAAGAVVIYDSPRPPGSIAI